LWFGPVNLVGEPVEQYFALIKLQLLA
jgi:hypothetical protein